MADFEHTRIPEDASGQTQTMTVVGPTGTVMNSKRLLGDTGAAVPGRGGWFRSNGLWKTFMAYNVDRKTVLGVALDIRIEAAMELADNADVDTFIVLLATLTSAAPAFSTEHPWRWLRARVVNAGGGTIQVGLHEQGQG